MPSTSILSSSLSISGDLSFFETGSSVKQNVYNIVPNGTASLDGFSNTTAELEYGINLITTGTSASYCAILPQPTTGKSVTIINKSGVDIKVFPSNVGGDINGNINGYISIPSNGISYVLNCYENPLPGGWSVIAQTSNSTTITSNVISGSLSRWVGLGGRHVWTFINQQVQASGSGTVASTPSSFYNYNQYGLFSQPGSAGVGSYNVPDNGGSLTNIKIITNITGSTEWKNNIDFSSTFGALRQIRDANDLNQDVWFNYSTDTGYTNWATNFFIPWLNANPGNGNIDTSGFSGGGGFLNVTKIVVPGTFTPGSGVSGSILANNPGEPGTLTFEINYTPPSSATLMGFGLTNLGITQLNSFTTDDGTLANVYWIKCFGLNLFNYSSDYALPNLKVIPQYTFTS